MMRHRLAGLLRKKGSAANMGIDGWRHSLANAKGEDKVESYGMRVSSSKMV